MYHRYYVPDDVSGNLTDRVDDHCSGVDNDRNIRTSWWIFEQNSVRNPWNSDRSRDRSSGSDGIWKSSRDHRYNVSDIEALNYVGQNTKIKIGELLFAGIIISALGAVMDVGMSIASTIQEIYETDKTLSMKRLFVSGINVGRDMMGTMTNTLIFAYVGGAMTTLVINYAYDLSYRQLANSYVIGIEIMQGLSGSLGVVLTVPITALIASFLAVRKK